MAEISLAEIGSALQGIGSVLGAIAVAYAAWLASNTFEGWRKQKLSERRIEQAERILTATYKARRALEYVRGPFMPAYELSTAEADLEKQEGWSRVPEDRKQSYVTAQAHFNRLKAVVEERRAVDECLPMARALFGEEVEGALEILGRQFHLVSTAAEAIRWETNDRDLRSTIADNLYSISSSGQPNRMNVLIAEQITLIEAACLPVLRLEVK